METSDFISIYFTEEKIESLFFIIIGFISITLSVIFLGIIKYSFFKGMAIPLLLIGILQVTVGNTIFNRSEKDINRMKHIIKNKPYLIKTEELPRMEVVITNFSLYKYIEIILVIIGICLWIGFSKSSQIFWKGIGIGIVIQSSIMLSLDIIAKKRADTYFFNLNSGCPHCHITKEN